MYLDVVPTTQVGRLIPLFLKSVPRRQKSESFQCWDPISQAEPHMLPPPKVEIIKARGRPGPLTQLTIAPYTALEWSKVMEEVKTLYFKKQYSQCSARCKQILETFRDRHCVRPLYSIYLCFFAASSLELQARALHNNSSMKIPLFNESLTYYQSAKSYMEFAAFATNPDMIRTSPSNNHQHNSSISSSIRSSVDSIFSQSSTSSVASSIFDSPTSEFSPSSELTRKGSTGKGSSSILRPASLRMTKKRVSFNLADEPRLEDSQDGGSTAEELLSRFPSPPTHDIHSPTIIPQSLICPFFHSPPRSPSSPYSYGTPNPNTTAAATSSASSASQYSLPASATAHSASRTAESLTRYRKHLDCLKDQLEYHTTSLNAQIHTLTTIRRARRSNGPDLFAIPAPYNRLTWSGSQSTASSPSPISTPGHSPSNSIHSTLGDTTSQAPVATSPTPEPSPTILTAPQTLDLDLTPEMLPSTPLPIKSRIQRLKERDWLRPRFNPDRYQALCEKAIQEIQEDGWRSSVR